MKREYEIPEMDIVKFSMDKDVMASGEQQGDNPEDFGNIPSSSSL